MELLMKNIHMCRRAKQVEKQVVLEEDLNVLDAKPDVEMIIQSQEHVVVEHTRAETGKLYADGYMEVGILYLDDTAEHRLHRLETRLPFDETIVMENLESWEDVRLHYETEDLNVSLINSRKLAIRAIVRYDASVDEIYDIRAAAGVQTELPICQKKKKLELITLAVQKKDILRLKEEIPLPSNKPNIRELLWENVQLRSTRIQLQEGKLAVQGKLFFFVLYRAEDEGASTQWLEQVIPFEGEVACGDCTEEMIPDIEVMLAQEKLQMKEDTDGELRIFYMEGMLELQIRLYENEETEILEDLYSPARKLLPETESRLCEQFVMKNASRCKASGKIQVQGAKPQVLQVAHVTGSIKIDQVKAEEGGIRIEGAVPVSVLYISSDDSTPFAVIDGTVPFSHFAEVPGLDEKCRFTVLPFMEQLSATMADSEEIEIRLTAGLDIFVVRPMEQMCILGVEEQEYPPEALAAVPGITGYIVQENDSLWGIAKNYFLTPQQIVEMNNLPREEVKKGDRLILMKRVVIN